MDADVIVLHQVHPVKLAFDISASVASALLLWQQRSSWGVVALHYGLPLVGSYVVLRWADVERLRRTRRGRYVLAHMPRGAQAVRLAGDAVIAYGSWCRRPGLIAAGLGIVAAGWSAGLLPSTRG